MLPRFIQVTECCSFHGERAFIVCVGGRGAKEGRRERGARYMSLLCQYFIHRRTFKNGKILNGKRQQFKGKDRWKAGKEHLQHANYSSPFNENDLPGCKRQGTQQKKIWI